jgi:hypothetical protein
MDLEYRKLAEKRLTGKDKIIIALGDSFTRGEGACSLEFGKKYNWDWYSTKYNINQKNEISKTFYDNSWVHQLCNNYMMDYEPLNLGLTGRGNRATIKELYLCPEMKLHEKKEIIVIFMLTGMERYDFFQGDFDENSFFKTMWPKLDDRVANNPDKNLWEAYFNNVWSDRFSIMEMLMNVQEIKTWCLAHNAKLMLTSAFRPDYQKNEFLRLMNKESNNFIKTNQPFINYLIDMFDWENFIRPYGHRCITDFLCYLEDRTDLIIEDLFGLSSKFYEFAYSNKEFSPKGFITNCAHPSALGNMKIAEMFYDNIKNNKFINLTNNNSESFKNII